MDCQNLFSGKNKKIIRYIRCLLKNLPHMLSDTMSQYLGKYGNLSTLQSISEGHFLIYPENMTCHSIHIVSKGK